MTRRVTDAEERLDAAHRLLVAAHTVAEADRVEIAHLREQKNELMVALREEGFELAAAMRIIARRDAEVERLREAIREVRATISGDGDTYLVEVICGRRSMRIAALADLHGHFPSDVPACDVAIIAGDVVNFDPDDQTTLRQQLGDFRYWLIELRHRGILPVGVAGNHDFAFQQMPKVARNMPWVYLEDSGVELGGINFWGSPWQPWMGGWAFNAPESDGADEPFLQKKFGQIPANTDVLITHSPPIGFHDTVYQRHAGSIALNEQIERVQPTLAVYGHIHKPGVERVDSTTLCNAAYVGYNRKPNRHPIQLFEL